MDLVANPGALSGAARQGARHPHRLGRLCGADQRFRRGHRPRDSRARSGNAGESRRGAAVVRQLRQSARRHRRLLARCAGRCYQGADRRSQCRDAVHLVSDQFADPVEERSTRAWRTRPSPRSWWRSATPGNSRPKSLQAVTEGPAVFSRSSDRMLRAITLYTRYGRLLARTRVAATAAPFPGMPKLGKGAQPEWLGKKILAAAGIRVPDGELARTVDEAVAVAERVGYPVALKAQAAALTHKTEAGGVMLNLADEAALRAAWTDDASEHQARGARRDARRLPGRKMSPEGSRADDRRQTRSRLGRGAAARARRHLGRGAGRRAAAAGRRRRDAGRSRRCTSCARRSCSPASAARRRWTSTRWRRPCSLSAG